MDSSDEKQSSHTDESSEIVDLNFISNLLIKEIQIPILQFLPPDTYKIIAKFIRKLMLQCNENLESKIKDELIRLTAKTDSVTDRNTLPEIDC